jgi:ABC-type multidrug transport system permease subunit
LLKTIELTLPQEQVKMPPEHEQFYQYYSGYSAIFEDILGFQGQTQITIQKDKTTVALTSSGEALLYVEATNVWGTTFHQIISVQPYSTPQWHVPLTQATIYLIVIVIIAIIVSFVTYFVKAKQ